MNPHSTYWETRRNLTNPIRDDALKIRVICMNFPYGKITEIKIRGDMIVPSDLGTMYPCLKEPFATGYWIPNVTVSPSTRATTSPPCSPPVRIPTGITS